MKGLYAMKLRMLRDSLIYLLIFACFMAIIVSQIYLSMSKESTTEDAVMFTTRHSLSFTGVIVRDEKLVRSQNMQDGVLNYCVSDGARLSKRSQIARIYTSYDQIYYRYRIERLDDMIEVLEKAHDKGTTEYAQPEFISSQITEEYKAILSDVAQGNLSQMYKDKLDMLKLMCIYNVASNAESDYSIKIIALKEEKSRYEDGLSNPISVVSATESGYFTSVVDGYESKLSLDGIGDMTVDGINEIIASPKNMESISPDVIGKVFSDYTWKLVGVINTPDRYFVNQSFNVIFSSINKSYECYVESITLTGNGDEAIIVLSCDEMDAQIAASRVLDAEILFGEYTGVKAPRRAIRFRNNEKGVYVLEGEKMIFKKLDVKYEGDDYVLSKYTTDKEYLELYDRVLLDPVPTVVLPEENEDKNQPDDGGNPSEAA